MRKFAIIGFLFCFLGVSLFAENKVNVPFTLGSLSGNDNPENHFVFSGGVYIFPFSESEKNLLKRLGFGGEIGKSVLSSQNESGLRLQRQLWLPSLNAKFNALSLANFNIDFLGGITFARDTEVLQVIQYGRWVRIENFGFKCNECKRSWDIMKNYGFQLSYSFSLGDEFKIAPLFRYNRYSGGGKDRGDFNSTTFGVELKF